MKYCMNLNSKTQKAIEGLDKRGLFVSFFTRAEDRHPVKMKLSEALFNHGAREDVERLRYEHQASITGDCEEGREIAKKRSEAKKKLLPRYTISAICEGGHGADCVKERTSLICLDFDKQDNEQSDGFAFLKRNCAAVPWVLYCGLSCRGEGYFVIMPIKFPNKHLGHYEAAVRLFEELLNVSADKQCKDLTRLRNVSIDDDPYINPSAEAFPFTYEEPPKGNGGSLSGKPYGNGEESGSDLARVKEALAKAASEGIVLSDDRADWVRMGYAFANAFGEDGREPYHEFSAQSHKYKEAETEAHFNSALKGRNAGEGGGRNVGIGTFFYICRKFGLPIPSGGGFNAKSAFEGVD